MARYSSPLNADTISPLHAPPVRMGLLAKLNLLTIGLIVATAVGISAFLLLQEMQDEKARLHARGLSMTSMLAELAAHSVSTGDKASLDRILATMAPDQDLAYVMVSDAQLEPLAQRSFARTAVAATPLRGPSRTAIESRANSDAGHNYIEFVAPVAWEKPPGAAMLTPASSASAEAPAGYVQLAVGFDRQQAQLRNNLMGAFSVVGGVVVLAILLTLLLTRRLVSPIRQLMRAARAIGAGKLDVYVPARTSDELGLLTHTFNHMTQRLSESQAEVAGYQKTLEEKVAQRTKELEVATAQAYKLAQHDILTGLPNRALLNQRLRHIIAQAHRDGHQVACLFLDFDHFKRINDTLGHDAGDQLLQAVAQRLTSAIREADTVARLGGDEFVVVLPGLDPTQGTFELMAVITRIRESFLSPFRLGDQTPTLTCSIGVSMYPIDAQDPGSLIKQADTAMYAAKDAGRNVYRFYTADMNLRVQARLQLETDMRRGLMEDEFFLVYQPQVDMGTGRAVGVEALLRWRDPVRGVIGPAEFISVAEESGMIQVLGARVLRDACRQVMLWHRQGMPLRLSVNLSVQQLQHDSWLGIVQEALRSSGLAPHNLDLEITESVIITHPEKAVATLVKLKQMGVSITVDDFGTGYSSLSYLARLPIEGVKIDQRFVHGIEQAKNDEAITTAIIALSHSLGLRVIAEGVETGAQYEFLKRHGCEEAQGYLISRPLPEAELRAWWRMQEEENRIVGRQADMWQRDMKG